MVKDPCTRQQVCGTAHISGLFHGIYVNILEFFSNRGRDIIENLLKPYQVLERSVFRKILPVCLDYGIMHFKSVLEPSGIRKDPHGFGHATDEEVFTQTCQQPSMRSFR